MPILKLNKNSVLTAPQEAPSRMFRRFSRGEAGKADIGKDRFYIAVDQQTYNLLAGYGGGAAGDEINSLLGEGGLFSGVIQGYSAVTKQKDLIRIDQGLDTNQISPEIGLDGDLQETAFIVELDYRLGRVKSATSDTPTPVNFIDDDNIASYYLTSDPYVNPGNISPAQAADDAGSKKQADLKSLNPQVFEGPRGSTLHFRIHGSQELQSSTYLFTEIGNSETPNAEGNVSGFYDPDTRLAGLTTYYLDSTVRVVGANTGYRLDIPVRYIKIA